MGSNQYKVPNPNYYVMTYREYMTSGDAFSKGDMIELRKGNKFNVILLRKKEFYKIADINRLVRG